MKYLFIFFWISLNLIFLLGCWDRTEINDIALIQGVGIDQKENGNIEVTVEFASPKMMSSGQAGGGGGGPEMLTRRGEGETLAYAITNLQEKLPRKVFWGQNKVIVLGENLAKKGIRENLDFFMRHPQPRLRSYVFVTRGNAKDVMALLPPLEHSSSEVLREMAKSHILLGVTLKDLALMLHQDGGATALPMIHVLPPEKGLKKLQTIANPYVKSTAIFKEGKMIGTMNDKQTRGILWLKNDIREAAITVKPDKGKNRAVTVRINQANSKLIPKIENGKWKMTVHLGLKGDMIQNETDLNMMDPKLSHDLEHLLAEDVENRIQSMLRTVQKEKKADVIGFGEHFRQKYPQEWKKVKDHWDEVFPTVEVAFHTRVEIRSGMATTPPALPKKEVKK